MTTIIYTVRARVGDHVRGRGHFDLSAAVAEAAAEMRPSVDTVEIEESLGEDRPRRVIFSARRDGEKWYMNDTKIEAKTAA